MSKFKKILNCCDYIFAAVSMVSFVGIMVKLAVNNTANLTGLLWIWFISFAYILFRAN